MTPPKTPRATTVIPRDRDVRVTKVPTPSPGSLATISSGVPAVFDFEEPTSPHATDFETMQLRVQRGAHHSKVAADQITQVRTEFREDLGRVHDRIDVLGENYGELASKVSGVDGKLDILVKFVERQTDTQAQHSTVTLTAKVDIEKAEKLDVIEEKKWRRDVVLKVLAAVGSGGAITVLIAALLGKC